jgi:hypothetical protein
MDSAAPKRAAREAAGSSPFRALARGGYAANGVVHILIGGIALVVALGGRGATDQSGALMAIARVPFGFVLLWILAVGLCGLGLWQVVEGILASPSADDPRSLAQRWGRRLGAWGQAAIFIALGLISAAVALGARIDTEEAAENASAGLLEIPGGPIVLGLVGLGIGIGGIVFIAMGLRRSFRTKIEIPEHGAGRSVAGLGLVGFLAKGVALVIVGILLVVASFSSDADTAGGLDGALRALLQLFYGPALVAAVGVGFVAYGVFCLFRARFARLEPA